MANQKSAISRIRSSETKRLRNRYQLKHAGLLLRDSKTTNQQEAEVLFKRVSSMLDRLAKRKILHKNKVANSKSTLAKLVNGLD